MTVSRRNVLLFGGLGALTAGGLSVPTRSLEAKSISALATSELPRPFRTAFVQPPVLQPTARSVDPDGSPVHQYTSARSGQATGLKHVGFFGEEMLGCLATEADAARFTVAQVLNTSYLKAAPAVSNLAISVELGGISG